MEPVLSLDEALNSQLAQERHWCVEVPLQEGDTMTQTQLACPIKFSRSALIYTHVGKTLGADNWL